VQNDLLISRLAVLDTCAISDALDQLAIAGVVLGLRPCTVRKKIVGMAVTVQLDSDDGRPSKRHLCTAAVDASGPGDVIVIAHGGRSDVAGWGGMLSIGAVTRGIEGIVIDGAFRDQDQSEHAGLAIYARGSVPITARGRVIETAWNVPVTVGSICVAPGDLVLADGSGVVFVPLRRAEEILDLAEKVADRETVLTEHVTKGVSMSEVMGTAYEDMLKKRGA
jgi:regulator of RNase E activity RraA